MDATAPTGPKKYRNQAATRVLKVLGGFLGHDRPCGVSELARELSFNKNMVHRALTTLLSENLLTRDETGERYQLGYRWFAFAVADASEFDIVALARPCLEQLHALTGESVYLSIIVGRNRVTVDDIQAQGQRVLRSRRGDPVPLHCTKMSRVLLAHLSDEDVDDYLDAASPLERPLAFPDPPSRSRTGVWRDIREIRAVPYVLWRNPHLSSAAYAILPILDANKRPHAIVTIGGPRERFDLPRIEALLPRIGAIVAPLETHARLFPAPAFLVDT
jgi:DNA-binding IclR family transcriptional regulator